MNKNALFSLALLRLALGWIFLWTFLDKLFGLGFSTAHSASWIAGGSPTYGFLANGTNGPLGPLFHVLAGNPLVDWLFMLGMAFVGISFILGICMRLAAATGVLMMALIYAAGFLPPKQNPFVDEHIIYILSLLAVSLADAGTVLGWGSAWQQTALVRRHPVLR